MIGQIVRLVVCLVASLLAGAIGGLFTSRAIPTWYATLTKPSFTPPGWLFGPVWTALYLMMGVAAFLVWRSAPGATPVRVALVLFVVQLVLNALWSVAFFGLHSPGGGMVVIALLWLAIAATLLTFSRVSTPAALLLAPYLAWVSFAAVLNWALYRLNP
jgi:translocator protein